MDGFNSLRAAVGLVTASLKAGGLRNPAGMGKMVTDVADTLRSAGENGQMIAELIEASISAGDVVSDLPGMITELSEQLAGISTTAAVSAAKTRPPEVLASPARKADAKAPPPAAPALEMVKAPATVSTATVADLPAQAQASAIPEATPEPAVKGRKNSAASAQQELPVIPVPVAAKRGRPRKAVAAPEKVTESISEAPESAAAASAPTPEESPVTAEVTSENEVPAEKIDPALIPIVPPEGKKLRSVRRPAVKIKDSLQPDGVICLEDGVKKKMLKRHLRTAWNMTPEQYIHRWKLPPDYPMVAPQYSLMKSKYAKLIGLGTQKTRPKVPEEA